MVDTSMDLPIIKKRFHNHSPIEFNSNRGGINLETEKTHEGTTSRLLLTRADFRDGGNYTCMPHGAIPASGFVHVLNGERKWHSKRLNAVRSAAYSNSMTFNAIFCSAPGEHPAAKYTSGASLSSCFSHSVVPCTTFLLLYHHCRTRIAVTFLS